MNNSDAFSNFWSMRFLWNLSKQHNVIMIPCKKMTYWAGLFRYIMNNSIIVSLKINSSYSSFWKIRLLNDLLVDGIFGRTELWILFVEILGTGFKEFINRFLFTLKLLFRLVYTYNKWCKALLLIISIDKSYPK